MWKWLFEYIEKQLSEKIHTYHTCKWCSKEYPIFDKEKTFLEKRNLDFSELCFDCRFRNMLMWRNEKKLYWRKSDKTWKRILSMYSPEYKWKVYNYDEWEQEWWFASINIDFNANEDFISNYYKLFLKIPKPWTDIFRTNENINFCNRTWRVKNAYYSFTSFENCEDLYFSNHISESKDIYNSTRADTSILVYESTFVYNSYKIFFCDNINNSKEIYFSYELKDCEECIFCSNLVGKKYMIYNKEYKKEEYENIKSNLKQNMSSYQKLENMVIEYETSKIKILKKWINNIWSENVIWNKLNNSNNCILCHNILGWDNCFNSIWWFPANEKNIFNSYWFWAVENMNLSMWNWPWNNLYFTINIEDSDNIYFSQKIKWCHYCIWCYGLQNASYHILNKPYSKEEYNELFPKIIENIKNHWHYNDFFSPKHSPFPINDTCIMEEFPINKLREIKNYNWWDLENYSYNEKIIDLDWKWIIYILYPEKNLSDAIIDFWWKEKINTLWRNIENEITIPKWLDKITYDKIPDNIYDLEESIIEKAIKCKETWRYYRFIKKELDFCKKYSIALPRNHPDNRIDKRRQKSPKLNIELIKCHKCKKETLSVYPEKLWNIVVCEDCYNKEIY